MYYVPVDLANKTPALPVDRNNAANSDFRIYDTAYSLRCVSYAYWWIFCLFLWGYIISFMESLSFILQFIVTRVITDMQLLTYINFLDENHGICCFEVFYCT